MPWHYWVLRSFARAEPPKEWEEILKYLKDVLPHDYINKIEVAAFTIPEKRTARWKINRGDKNYKYYSSRSDALGVARKLAWLMLKSRDAPKVSPNLQRLLNPNNEFPDEFTACPICKKILHFKDFELFGRKDPSAIQMGHLTPLSRLSVGKGHNAQNIVWVHRRCNDIQDEETVSETIDTLRQILERHGYKISSKS